jgi:hypothetical protein
VTFVPRLPAWKLEIEERSPGSTVTKVSLLDAHMENVLERYFLQFAP